MPIFKDRERRRGFIAGVVVAFVICSALLLYYATITHAVSPTVAYASPANGATFVPVWRGKGVNVTVNVSDADGDLQQVILKWNDSGVWKTFYSSGLLGGVAYHNFTVLNSNFTGSWVTYEYQICANDTAGWNNVTYSFTTEYVWGDPVMVYYDDLKSYEYATVFKNKTDEYYLALYDQTNHDAIALTSLNGLDWVTRTYTTVDDTAQDDKDAGVWSWFNYNGYPAFFYVDDGDPAYWRIAYYNGSAWDTVSTGIIGRGSYGNANNERQGIGADIKYYDGQYHLVISRSGGSGDYYWYLSFYHGTPPNSWTLISNVETFSNSDADASRYSNFQPSLNILDGYLILTYIDDADGAGSGTNGPMHWYVYDGVTLTDKGTVSSTISGLSVEKDPVNNQLVAVYTNETGEKLCYRILDDPSGSWSDEYIIMIAESGCTLKNPQVHYIDNRLVVTFAYNLRGNYNIYMISAPEYLSSASGVLQQYNRIQFPDAIPNQAHVNSSVFYFKNINSRNITWINWSFSDIGSIQCENNFVLWGSLDNTTWTKIGTADANGYVNMTSTTWASGLPWETGEIRYFKVEILDIGDVVEDLHSCDESIILKVGLA